MRIQIAAALLLVAGVVAGKAAGEPPLTKAMRCIGFGWGDGYHAAPRPRHGQPPGPGSECVWGRCSSVNSSLTPEAMRYFGSGAALPTGPGFVVPGQPSEGQIIDLPPGQDQPGASPSDYLPGAAPSPARTPTLAPPPALTPTAAPAWGPRYDLGPADDLDAPHIEPAPPYRPAPSLPQLQTGPVVPSGRQLPPGVEPLPPVSQVAMPSGGDRFVFPWRR